MQKDENLTAELLLFKRTLAERYFYKRWGRPIESWVTANALLDQAWQFIQEAGTLADAYAGLAKAELFLNNVFCNDALEPESVEHLKITCVRLKFDALREFKKYMGPGKEYRSAEEHKAVGNLFSAVLLNEVSVKTSVFEQADVTAKVYSMLERFNLKTIRLEPGAPKKQLEQLTEIEASLHKSAKTYNVPDEAIGLNCTLSLDVCTGHSYVACKGKYDSTEKMIFVRPGGSVMTTVHEWFHALENYIGHAVTGDPNCFASLDSEEKETFSNGTLVSSEHKAAFAAIKQMIQLLKFDILLDKHDLRFEAEQRTLRYIWLTYVGEEILAWPKTLYDKMLDPKCNAQILTVFEENASKISGSYTELAKSLELFERLKPELQKRLTAERVEFTGFAVDTDPTHFATRQYAIPTYARLLTESIPDGVKNASYFDQMVVADKVNNMEHYTLHYEMLARAAMVYAGGGMAMSVEEQAQEYALPKALPVEFHQLMRTVLQGAMPPGMRLGTGSVTPGAELR